MTLWGVLALCFRSSLGEMLRYANATRKPLAEYMHYANQVAHEPHWYNSLTTNCTTVFAKMLRAVGNGVLFDWRIIVNGYLPEYGYERASLNTGYSI